MTSCSASWQASPRIALRGFVRGDGARRSGACVRVVTHAQASGPRASSPQKSRPTASSHLPLRRKTGGVDPSGGGNNPASTASPGTVSDGNSSRGDVTTTRAATASTTSSGTSTSTSVGATSSHHHIATCASFQRTSWYGAVSSNSPPPTGGKNRVTTVAAAAGGDAGSSGASPPNIVKKATGGASPSTTSTSKPFVDVEPASQTAELKLPRESDDGKKDGEDEGDDKKGGSTSSKKPILTRLLRTPLSGGVLNSMKDRDLPSVAVAARNLMELADYADLSTIMSNMNHRRSGYPFASTVDFATDADG